MNIPIARKNSAAILLGVTVSISNLSQLPVLLNNNSIKAIIFAVWIGLLLYVLSVSKPRISKQVLSILFILLLWDIYLLAATLLFDSNYIDSAFVYPVHLSIFILTVAYLVGRISIIADFHLISKYYIYSALFVGIYIYFHTYSGVDWSTNLDYLYTSKNSIAQVMLVAILLLIMFYKNHYGFIKYGMISFFGLLLLMLKSRATLVGLILSIGYIGFILKGRYRIAYLLIICIGTALILCNPQINDLIINRIILNNRGMYDLDTITSGRLSHLQAFAENFRYQPWVGGWDYFIESFPLAILMGYGIIGSIPLFWLSIKPILIGLKNNNKQLNKLRNLLIILSIIMLVNGLFEQLAPFGPGVKCYMLWLVCGYYLGLDINHTKKTTRIYVKQ